MRRRRHQLQVDTFPFLAVLLAAMGALILFLFIMDRRAKIVARNKALDAAAARKSERERERNRRLLELQAAAEKDRDLRWQAILAERAEKRRLIEDDLARRHRELLDLLKETRQGAERTKRTVALDRARLSALLEDLAQEETRLRRERDRLLEEQKRLQTADIKKDALARERERLTLDLLRLEKTLQDLHLARHKKAAAFSLVPYRGRRGEARRPVYVECTTRGLVFQPEGRRLSAWDLDPAAFRQEVERRGVAVAKDAPPPRESSPLPLPPPRAAGPYVLFLVRPDGLDSYYAALGALRGFAVEFGYELLDGDMALDFSSDNVAGLGFDSSAPHGEPRPGLGFGTGGPNGGSPGNGNSPGVGGGPGMGTSSGPPSMGIGTGPFPLGQPGGTAAGPRGNGPVLGLPVGGSSGRFSPLAGLTPSGNAGSGPDRVGLGTPSLGSPLPSDPNQPGTGTGKGNKGALGNGADQPGSPGTGRGGLGPVGTGPGGPEKYGTGQGATGKDGPGGNGSGMDSNQSGPGAGPKREPGTGSVFRPSTGKKPASATSAPEAGGNSQPSSQGRSPEEKGTTPTRTDDPWRTAGPLARKIPGAKPPPDQENQQRPEGPRPDFVEGGGGVSDGTPGLPGGRGPRLPQRPSSLGSLLANRDYRVTLICTEDALYVLPGGRVYSMTNPDPDLDRKVVENVVQMIARRQSGVRPGEPPYRPLLRFQVHPAGLRTYYRIYPLFENLKIPMSRENVE